MIGINLPPFTGRNVPVSEIAAAMGLSESKLRDCLLCGEFSFGVRLNGGVFPRKEDIDSIEFYCSDKKVWEETGYFNPDFSLKH